jgi:hypothetical protein
MLDAVADGIAAGLAEASGRRAVRAAIGHALAFSTWRSLAVEHGLTDRAAAALMARLPSLSSPNSRGRG